MKPALFLFAFIFLISGIILFNSSPKSKSASMASNPTATSISVTPTEIIPTQAFQKSTTKIQVIKATYGPPLGFYPTEFTVKAGIPVRLEVYASENGRGCMGSITIPDLTSYIQGFTKGQTNIFEFTPTIPGEYPITCAMGIPHGSLIVN